MGGQLKVMNGDLLLQTDQGLFSGIGTRFDCRILGASRKTPVTITDRQGENGNRTLPGTYD
jgi:hypothetical protein